MLIRNLFNSQAKIEIQIWFITVLMSMQFIRNCISAKLTEYLLGIDNAIMIINEACNYLTNLHREKRAFRPAIKRFSY